MTDNIYYYEPPDPAIQRVIDSECPTCEGTGIAPNVIYTPDLVEGVDFEWCETCAGTGEVEEIVESTPTKTLTTWWTTYFAWCGHCQRNGPSAT